MAFMIPLSTGDQRIQIRVFVLQVTFSPKMETSCKQLA
jgi:hypothetical protein